MLMGVHRKKLEMRTPAVQPPIYVKNHVILYYIIAGTQERKKKQKTFNIPVFLHHVNV